MQNFTPKENNSINFKFTSIFTIFTIIIFTVIICTIIGVHEKIISGHLFVGLYLIVSIILMLNSVILVDVNRQINSLKKWDARIPFILFFIADFITPILVVKLFTACALILSICQLGFYLWYIIPDDLPDDDENVNLISEV